MFYQHSLLSLFPTLHGEQCIIASSVERKQDLGRWETCSLLPEALGDLFLGWSWISLNCTFCLLRSLAWDLLSLKGNQFLKGIFKIIFFPSSVSTGCSPMLLQSQEYCREGPQGVSPLLTVLNKQFQMNLMGYTWLGFKAVWASTVCSHHA